MEACRRLCAPQAHVWIALSRARIRGFPRAFVEDRPNATLGETRDPSRPVRTAPNRAFRIPWSQHPLNPRCGTGMRGATAKRLARVLVAGPVVGQLIKCLGNFRNTKLGSAEADVWCCWPPSCSSGCRTLEVRIGGTGPKVAAGMDEGRRPEIPRQVIIVRFHSAAAEPLRHGPYSAGRRAVFRCGCHYDGVAEPQRGVGEESRYCRRLRRAANDSAAAPVISAKPERCFGCGRGPQPGRLPWHARGGAGAKYFTYMTR